MKILLSSLFIQITNMRVRLESRLGTLIILNVFCLIFAPLSAPESAPAAKQWQKLDNCALAPNEYNDGDSFHVKCGQTEYLFRLYFVDAPESDGSLPERLKQQAAYFGVSAERALNEGQSAKKFTNKLLTGRKITVWTRWKDAWGRSKLDRYFAFVYVDGQDIAQELVRAGLARIYGVRGVLPNGQDTKSYISSLKSLESDAKKKLRGAWAK